MEENLAKMSYDQFFSKYPSLTDNDQKIIMCLGRTLTIDLLDSLKAVFRYNSSYMTEKLNIATYEIHLIADIDRLCVYNDMHILKRIILYIMTNRKQIAFSIICELYLEKCMKLER